jgi:hypothetical protein
LDRSSIRFYQGYWGLQLPGSAQRLRAAESRVPCGERRRLSTPPTRAPCARSGPLPPLTSTCMQVQVSLRDASRCAASVGDPAPPASAPGRCAVWAGVLVLLQGSGERLCENPEIENRVPTPNRDRAPARESCSTSRSLRASPTGRGPTGPTFHTVWRGVRRRAQGARRKESS